MATSLRDNDTTRCWNEFGPIVEAGCASGGRDVFDFTLLFEQSILAIGPSTLLLLAIQLRSLQLLKQSRKTQPGDVLARGKLATIAVFGALQLAQLVLWVQSRKSRGIGKRISIAASVLALCDALAIAGLSFLEHTRSIRPSTIISTYLLFSTGFDAVQCRTLWFRSDAEQLSTIAGVLSAIVAIKLAILALEAKKEKRPYLLPGWKGASPEALSGIFSRSFNWWLMPMFVSGFQKIITIDDLYSWSFVSLIFPRLCLIGSNYAQPFLISSAILYISEPFATRDRSVGYGLAAAAALIYPGIAISQAHFQRRQNRLMTSFRGAMVSLIYAKTLRLQAGIYSESAALTLMSTDVDQAIMGLQAVSEIWARVIEISIGVWLLERQLGWVCVAPLFIDAVCVYGGLKVNSIMVSRQKQWTKAIQRRVGITSSMLDAMKNVKMTGLSAIMFNIIQSQRVRELELSKRFRVMGLWRLLLATIPEVGGPFGAFVIFAVVKGSGHLPAQVIFSSLAIITLLTSPASELLQRLPGIGQGLACMDRIQAFLLSMPQQDGRFVLQSSVNDSKRLSAIETGINMKDTGIMVAELNAIILDGVSIKPAPGDEIPTRVHNVSFTVPTGSLTMIVGSVGSGKSTLLKAILGELAIEQGSIQVSTKIMAYCSHSAWLPNATVRQIVCGPTSCLTNDEKWYKSVVHACAFDEDILQLPDQDDTLIGSRGITLSGGQRQRLALARAMYSRAKITVLDDVISALDGRTAKKVVDRLLGKDGIFRQQGSTVILVTHAVSYLPLADDIVVLDANGHIAEQGSYDHLRSQNGFVSRLTLNPEILEESSTKPEDDDIKDPNKSRPATVLPKALRGSSSNDVENLTRRTGDLSVYKYYIASIGWKLGLGVWGATFLYALTSNFPQLWLNWYANGRRTRRPGRRDPKAAFQSRPGPDVHASSCPDAARSRPSLGFGRGYK